MPELLQHEHVRLGGGTWPVDRLAVPICLLCRDDSIDDISIRGLDLVVQVQPKALCRETRGRIVGNRREVTGCGEKCDWHLVDVVPDALVLDGLPGHATVTDEPSVRYWRINYSSYRFE